MNMFLNLRHAKRPSLISWENQKSYLKITLKQKYNSPSWFLLIHAVPAGYWDTSSSSRAQNWTNIFINNETRISSLWLSDALTPLLEKGKMASFFKKKKNPPAHLRWSVQRASPFEAFTGTSSLHPSLFSSTDTAGNGSNVHPSEASRSPASCRRSARTELTSRQKTLRWCNKNELHGVNFMQQLEDQATLEATITISVSKLLHFHVFGIKTTSWLFYGALDKPQT